MNSYIFWVDHVHFGKMHVLIPGNNRDNALKYASNNQEFKSWEYVGILCADYSN